MIDVRLAKACRRRNAGAPMTVTERAAYRMMVSGEIKPDVAFMAAFEKTHGLPAAAAEEKPTMGRRGRKPKQ